MSFLKNPMAFWLILGLIIGWYRLLIDVKALTALMEPWGISAAMVLILFGLLGRVMQRTKYGEKERLQARVKQLEQTMTEAGTPIPPPLPDPT